MNTNPAPDVAELRALAEQEALSFGMTILERSWVSGTSEVAFLASAPGGVLVGVVVLDSGTDVDDFTDDQVTELRDSAQDWLDEHQATFKDIRIDAARYGRHGFEYVTEVG